MKMFYHGTDIISAKSIYDTQKIDVRKGARNTDFGQGFYVTDDFERAKKWAYRKAFLRNSKPAIVTIIFDEEGANAIIEKFADDLRWGRFVINNRNGIKYFNSLPFKDNNLDARYDITFGRIADIDVINVADELRKSGEMLQSLDKILNTDYPLQYAFHTDRAVEYIKKITYQSIS